MKKIILSLMVLMALTLSFTAFASTSSESELQQERVCYGDRVLCVIKKSMELSSMMQQYVSYDIYGKIFLPIKVKAAIALDVQQDLGSYAEETREAIKEVIHLIENEKNYIESLLTTPAHFETARTLMRAVRLLKKELGINE